eukprot:scaffold13392_cov71-Phaeocystis_antarctica.AAC.3
MTHNARSLHLTSALPYSCATARGVYPPRSETRYERGASHEKLRAVVQVCARLRCGKRGGRAPRRSREGFVQRRQPRPRLVSLLRHLLQLIGQLPYHLVERIRLPFLHRCRLLFGRQLCARELGLHRGQLLDEIAPR